MRKTNYVFIFTLILTIEIAIGKNGNKVRNSRVSHKKHVSLQFYNRFKRSLDGNNLLLWTDNKKILDNIPINTKFDDTVEEQNNNAIDMEKEIPFWGSRGRRDSLLVKNYDDNLMSSKYLKERRDENDNPFWGSRGRRNSDEIVNSIPSSNKGNTHEPFWDNRWQRLKDAFTSRNGGIQQVTLSDANQLKSDNIPFWGYRGRREETEPFWGSRGRREESEPFWGSRGKKEENKPFWDSRGRSEDNEPFWGSRGKREKSEPFWGNRGRREESAPFWGSRGRREESEPFWGSRGRRLESYEEKTSHPNTIYYDVPQENLKQSIRNAIDAVENKIERLSRLRRSKSSFWSNRGRNGQISFLNNAGNRYQIPNNIMKSRHSSMYYRPSESSTVLNGRIYAEQPSYIVVERSSRSSAEDDPYFISRGKKKLNDFGVAQAVRDRRGVIEELVKTVQNDPYFIARGKKDSDLDKIGNLTVSYGDFSKAKDLICSTADLIIDKNKDHKIKRGVPDNERDRRTTLKKLAAQLQMDPYFVSRGKKSDINDSNMDKFQDFIRDIIEKCYYNVYW